MVPGTHAEQLTSHSSPRESDALFRPPWEPHTRHSHTEMKITKLKKAISILVYFSIAVIKNTLLKTSLERRIISAHRSQSLTVVAPRRGLMQDAVDRK